MGPPRAEGGTARIRVQFPRGPRSTEEEVVDAIPREALSAVVAAVRQTMGEGTRRPCPRSPPAWDATRPGLTAPFPAGGKENLKPHKLARISPRVFWNVARLFGGDISGGLRALLPDADWSFLASRARRQSAKARANALQQEADERGVPVEQVEAEVLAQEQDPGSEEEEEEDGRTAPTAGAAAAADGGHVLGAGVDAGTAAARGDAADDARRRRAAAAAARVGQQGPPGPPVPGAGQARAQSGEDGVREVVEEVVSGSEECEGGEVDAVLAKALAAGARTVGRLADLGDAPLVASGASRAAAVLAGG